MTNPANSTAPWMIYGVSGFTGKLILKEALRRGLRPVLAGRNPDTLRPLASAWGLEWRAFDLASKDLASHLQGMQAVLHCAGPFSQTSENMVQACLQTGTHYLDITGEIDVFEKVLQQDAEAKTRAVVLIPGVGFDVVPSDCLALELSSRLKNATSLELAFTGKGGISPGTLKTVVETLPHGGKVRRNGKIVSIPSGSLNRTVRFADRDQYVSAIPWGDVSTAYHSTGIPNITVYASVPKTFARATRVFVPAFGPVLRTRRVQNFLSKQISKRVKGPSETELRTGRMILWGEVRSESGEKVEGRLELPEGYMFTALASVACVEKVLAGLVKPGAWTPSRAFGSRFVTEIPGTKMTI